MTPRDFVFWLQGFFEITDPTEINEKQTQMIKNHLNLVFYHEAEHMGEVNIGDIKEEKPPVEILDTEGFGNGKDNFFKNKDSHDTIYRC